MVRGPFHLGLAQLGVSPGPALVTSRGQIRVAVAVGGRRWSCEVLCTLTCVCLGCGGGGQAPPPCGQRCPRPDQSMNLGSGGVSGFSDLSAKWMSAQGRGGDAGSWEGSSDFMTAGDGRGAGLARALPHWPLVRVEAGLCSGGDTGHPSPALQKVRRSLGGSTPLALSALQSWEGRVLSLFTDEETEAHWGKCWSWTGFRSQHVSCCVPWQRGGDQGAPKKAAL